MIDRIVSLGINGWLDPIPVPQVPRFHDELREHLRTEESIYREIRESKELPDELSGRIEQELNRFKGSFNVQEERSLVAT